MGESYVVFGKSGGAAVELSTISLDDDDGGFIIKGIQLDGFGFGFFYAGASVSGAGDVNGDGLDDLIVGAYNRSGYSRGTSYVVFGQTSGEIVELSNIAKGTGGFVMNVTGEFEGFSGGSYGVQTIDVSIRLSGAGDVNGDGLDDLLIGSFLSDPGGYSNAGKSYVVFSPSPVPLNVGVRDAVTDDPVIAGGVYIERLDAPLGFQSAFSGVDGNGDAILRSRDTDIIDYRVRATGTGFLPSDPVTVRPDDTGASVASVGLQSDANFDNANTLHVTIDLLDEFGASTGLQLLTDTVVLEQSSVDLEIDSIYGIGEMIFLGVPSGTIDVSVEDTVDFDFDPVSVTLGTGVSKSVLLTATLIEPSGLTRAALPGRIVGMVSNSTAVPATALPNALLVSVQASSGISTFTRASGTGTFFFQTLCRGWARYRRFLRMEISGARRNLWM